VKGAALLFDPGILAALREAGRLREPEPQGLTWLSRLGAGNSIALGRLVERRILVRLGLIGIDQAWV
jgi:hypothetical protein